jgi:hypothetical protein
MPSKEGRRTPADCLRTIADHLDAGEREADWGPLICLLGRAMMKRGKSSN